MTTPAPSDVQVGDWVRFQRNYGDILAIVQRVYEGSDRRPSMVATNEGTIAMYRTLEIRREFGR